MRKRIMQTNGTKQAKQGRKGAGPTAGSFRLGNRAGAKENMPRGRFITAQLIRHLNMELGEFDAATAGKDEIKKRTRVIWFFCKKLIQLALEGDTTAIKMVMDRIEGTPISTVQFKDVPEGEETPEQREAIMAAREKLKTMPLPQLHELYEKSFTETSGTAGSA